MEQNKVETELNEKSFANQEEMKPEQETLSEVNAENQNTETAKNESADENPPDLEKVRADNLREILSMIREAEKKGYERGRQDEKASRLQYEKEQLEKTNDMWHNRRISEAESADKIPINSGGDFLTRIRPSVWD